MLFDVEKETRFIFPSLSKFILCEFSDVECDVETFDFPASNNSIYTSL